MSEGILVGNTFVGNKYPTYFIADIAANHDHDLSRAKDLIYLCADSGANAAKFQNFLAPTIVSDFGFRSLGNQISHQASWGKSVFEVYDDASLPIEWTEILKETCTDAGIEYFTAPYDLGLVDILQQYVCAWKLGSGDITWHENIEILAKSEKPLLIATGASSMEDVRLAVDIAQKYTDKIILMQCNTNYTASLENFSHIALNVLKTYAKEFPNLILGLSDHTPGHSTVLGAVAMGARAIEKHFTDDTCRDGPDHKFSMDPKSWRLMVESTRELEAALGPSEKRIMENEKETVILQRRAIRAAIKIKIGSQITSENLAMLRPCPSDAFPPYKKDQIIGKFVKKDIEEGDYIRLSDLD